MRTKSATILFLFSILSIFSSCTKSNDEVEPIYPTEGNVEFYYNITTEGLNVTKQFVTVYNTENADKLEDLKLFEFGKNLFINVYMKDGRRIDITDQNEGGNLYDIIASQGIRIQDIDFGKHMYRNLESDKIVMLNTSIKVVHEILEDE
ncbi:hypothetical protein [Flammeovirga sp. SJP92]|uniref:hypothetical protein n=1 Tax=Flammeovirga sp. SJP92 TaxID=1775430 RepID=UPI0012FB4E5C|nr:hypothetical protein [Flammeovirga sp. SJP92]